MSKDREIICPVTFVGTEAQYNDNINALFTNAYNTKVFTDLSHSSMCDIIKSNREDLDNPHYIAWAVMTEDANRKASIDAVMAYLVSNITELCYQCLVRFLSDNFTMNALPNEDNSNSPLSTAELIGTFMRDIDIEGIVTMAIDATNIPYIDVYATDGVITAQNIYVTMDMCMNSIYSILLVKVFNRFINDHVNVAVQRGSLDRLYELLYVECYGEPEDHIVNIPDVNVEYAFCSSILRESMEGILGEFRSSLMMVAKTATCMIVNNPTYANHLLDPEYTTSNLLDDNSYIRSHITMKRIDDEEE